MTRDSRTGSARRRKCPRCGRPVLQQLVGRVAALDVTADDELLPADQAAALRTDNRLDWCLRTTRAGTELQWADCHRRRTPCPRPHVVDHVCTGPRVPSPARSRRRPVPVPAGQLTL
ncbi:hypothetical protein [Streptomyces sp. NPDC101115]|uniref:hypothetical protein n=1 Tax=Streptomyces sp. NPDC101115 TaxID=3366106 RepID=UPI00380A7E7A